MLRITLGLFWIATGAITLHPLVHAIAFDQLYAAGIPPKIAHLFVTTGAMADIALGLPFLVGWRTRLIGLLQLAMMIFYIAFACALLPHLLLDPFGPILKIIPIAMATLVVIAWAEPR